MFGFLSAAPLKKRGLDITSLPISGIQSNFKLDQFIKMSTKPSFDSLPLRKDGPAGNAWGLFGENDECGMLNLLTPDIVAQAASEIRDGVRVSTDWPLNRMSRPCFGRAPFKHEINTKSPRAVNDDTLTFNTQSSSQWDGFRHYAYQKEKLWFNGKSLDELLASDVNGIQGEFSCPVESSLAN